MVGSYKNRFQPPPHPPPPPPHPHPQPPPPPPPNRKALDTEIMQTSMIKIITPCFIFKIQAWGIRENA